jgi:inhibitor of KinA
LQRRILDFGDTAFTIEFGDVIDPRVHAEVDSLDAAIEAARAQGAFAGLVETVPTFRSLTVVFDPLLTDRQALSDAIMPLAGRADSAPPPASRHWRLPACYEGDAAPDLEELARTSGVDAEGVVRLHSQTEYVVYMLGFLPGFPFMGDVPEALRRPRRIEPRVRVPSGSVAIANGLTAIYPWESPGGWHLIGRCPVPLFDAGRTTPALLRAGDRVRFEPVSAAEYARIERALADGEIDPLSWCASRRDSQRGAA